MGSSAVSPCSTRPWRCCVCLSLPHLCPPLEQHRSAARVITLMSTAPLLADIVCHFLGGLLLSLVVMQKEHCTYAWHVFGFFSAIPAMLELATIAEILAF